MKGSRFERVRALYAGTAVILANLLLLLLVLNLLALPFTGADDLETGQAETEMEKLVRVYPGMRREEIRELVAETRSRPYAYEPFTQFRERPFRGRYVNVEEEGYRRSEPQSGWPPPETAPVLFFFGGSTAFGYGLPDRATIPSQLARLLAADGCEASVYNFGRSNYYSTQERILFQQLAARGLAPDVAVFLDGLNDLLYADDEPKFTRRLAYLMDEGGAGLARRAIASLPLVRALRARLPDRGDRAPGERWATGAASAAVERWHANRRLTTAAARELGVKALFVWQPIPAWEYDLGNHLFTDDSGRLHPGQELLAAGYELMAGRLGEVGDAELLWLADLQRDRSEPLYVDRFHYTESFSTEIAHAIAAAVRPALCPAPATEGGA